jgi:hypothetical protein
MTGLSFSRRDFRSNVPRRPTSQQAIWNANFFDDVVTVTELTTVEEIMSDTERV